MFLCSPRNRDVSRTRPTVAFGRNDLISSRAERIMGQPMSSVSVVVICSRNGPAGSLVLSDRPVLDVIIAAIDGADLITATIAVDRSNLRALAAGVVIAIVLENLQKHETIFPQMAYT
jgi:hypothetical protein